MVWAPLIIAGITVAMQLVDKVTKKPLGPTKPLPPKPSLYFGESEQEVPLAKESFAGMRGAEGLGNYWNEQAADPYGSMAFENQDLSNQEGMARGYDQAGAMQLAREAAMGEAPSEAAYQMQEGLNAAGAQQAAMAGGARGAAGLAMSQANAGANVANMQQNTFTAAGRLRAQEMAEARGMYGGLAGQMRQQDQNRLGTGNQMAQFNSNLGLQRQLGMGNLGLGYNAQRMGWLGQAGGWMNQTDQNNLHRYGLETNAINGQNNTNANIATANQNQSNAQMQQIYGTMAAGATSAGAAMQGQGGQGSGKIPEPSGVPGYTPGGSMTGGGGKIDPYKLG